MLTLSAAQLEKLREMFLPVIDGPHWTDACQHEPGSYVCTFEVMHRHFRSPFHKWTRQVYDLYLFKQEFHGTEVCLRYGNEGSEYCSPGGLSEFLHNANAYHHRNLDDEYVTAAKIIVHAGTITWTPRQVPV
jgi:hypothetical protein